MFTISQIFTSPAPGFNQQAECELFLDNQPSTKRALTIQSFITYNRFAVDKIYRYRKINPTFQIHLFYFPALILELFAATETFFQLTPHA